VTGSLPPAAGARYKVERTTRHGPSQKAGRGRAGIVSVLRDDAPPDQPGIAADLIKGLRDVDPEQITRLTQERHKAIAGPHKRNGQEHERAEG